MSLEIHKIFVLKSHVHCFHSFQYWWGLLKYFFEVGRNVKIWFISLFSLGVTCDIHFASCWMRQNASLSTALNWCGFCDLEKVLCFRFWKRQDTSAEEGMTVLRTTSFICWKRFLIVTLREQLYTVGNPEQVRRLARHLYETLHLMKLYKSITRGHGLMVWFCSHWRFWRKLSLGQIILCSTSLSPLLNLL